MAFKKAAPGPQTAEEQLALMRQGYKAELKIKVGGLEIPVRLMSATEEATVIANAKSSVKLPNKDIDPKQFTAMAVMKAILSAAATVDSTPRLSKKFLDDCGYRELNSFYDQYLTVCDTANPEFEQLSDKEIADLIVAVKKNEKAPADFFTSDLAAIGRFFLDRLQAQDSAPGSS